MIWYPSSDWNAQGAHLALGAVMVAAPGWLAGTTGALIGTAALVAYAIVKEVVIDPWIESEPFWPEGAKDVVFLCGGSAIAWAAFGVARLVG